MFDQNLLLAGKTVFFYNSTKKKFSKSFRKVFFQSERSLFWKKKIKGNFVLKLKDNFIEGVWKSQRFSVVFLQWMSWKYLKIYIEKKILEMTKNLPIENQDFFKSLHPVEINQPP